MSALCEMREEQQNEEGVGDVVHLESRVKPVRLEHEKEGMNVRSLPAVSCNRPLGQCDGSVNDQIVDPRAIFFELLRERSDRGERGEFEAPSLHFVRARVLLDSYEAHDDNQYTCYPNDSDARTFGGNSTLLLVSASDDDPIRTHLREMLRGFDPNASVGTNDESRLALQVGGVERGLGLRAWSRHGGGIDVYD